MDASKERYRKQGRRRFFSGFCVFHYLKFTDTLLLRDFRFYTGLIFLWCSRGEGKTSHREPKREYIRIAVSEGGRKNMGNSGQKLKTVEADRKGHARLNYRILILSGWIFMIIAVILSFTDMQPGEFPVWLSGQAAVGIVSAVSLVSLLAGYAEMLIED